MHLGPSPATLRERENVMRTIASVAAVLCVLSAPSFAATDLLGTLPSGSVTVTNWYKQSVYNPDNSKIGKVDDVLVDTSGKATALMVGVGGFLGAGEKDVAVPFDAVHLTKKDNSWYLVMDATKDTLKSAAGYKYDSGTTSW